MSLELSGTLPALVTPLEDGAVDEDALRALVERAIEGGVNGLVPCGTTGESATLDDAEHARVIRAVVAQNNGRVPVIAGAGSASTRHAVHLARQARDAGADGLLLVCPYYNRPTQAGLEGHFRAIAEAVPLPSVLYNVPARTGVDLSVETLARLADVDAFVAIKEATNTVHRSQQIRARLGDRYTVLSGDDALTLPILAVGGRGVISVTANAFPAAVSEVTRRWLAGDHEGALAQHLRLLPVHASMFIEANPGPVKAVMARAGRLAPEVRQPLAWPSEETIAAVADAAERAGLTP